MTKWSEVENLPNYVKVLDKGFVGLVDVMGNDAAIVQAARVSYGDGTKSMREDRGLIRYLMRNHHTTPFEMVEFKFHIKMPIFVMRQHIRHRTANVNEYSARYSVMADEFYIPEPERLQAQSQTNKQGSGKVLEGVEAEIALNTIKRVSTETYKDYLSLINHEDGRDYGITDPQGLTRELARTVLPVNNYTELYWKIDLKNLFHYLALRDDSHAQWEIQEFARAIGDFVLQKCPVAWEAFLDYWKNNKSLSYSEQVLLLDVIKKSNELGVSVKDAWGKIEHQGNTESIANQYRLSKRELEEFKSWLELS
jgi:thymidylate synthase (FAD)